MTGVVGLRLAPSRAPFAFVSVAFPPGPTGRSGAQQITARTSHTLAPSHPPWLPPCLPPIDFPASLTAQSALCSAACPSRPADHSYSPAKSCFEPSKYLYLSRPSQVRRYLSTFPPFHPKFPPNSTFDPPPPSPPHTPAEAPAAPSPPPTKGSVQVTLFVFASESLSAFCRTPRLRLPRSEQPATNCPKGAKPKTNPFEFFTRLPASGVWGAI